MHSSISKKECTCDRLPEPFQMQFKTDVNVIVDICVFLIVLILPLYKIKLPGRKYDTLIHINESKLIDIFLTIAIFLLWLQSYNVGL